MDLFPEGPSSAAAKEVALYRDALKLGFNRLRATDGLITNSTLIAMFQLLKQHGGGFRETPRTGLKNEASGEIVFVPPQYARDIISLMSDLEHYINEDNNDNLAPLDRIALIDHQLENIHPFPDSNGRPGRIQNVLYLARAGLLNIPALYLSRYITQNKGTYCQLLQAIRTDNAWEEWVLFILNAVAETSVTTLQLVEGIQQRMSDAKSKMRTELPKLYS